MKPAWFQRVAIGNNIEQVKKSYLISTAILFVIMLTIAWIPFLLWNLNSEVDSRQLVEHIIENYSFPGFKGLIAIAVTAMAMSTADSYINASSVLFANDLCAPLNIGETKRFTFSKIFAVLLGVGAILLATIADDLLDMMIIANSFYFPVVTPILFITILGFRSSAKVALFAMISGFLSIVIWKFIGGNKIAGIMFSIILNICTFFAAHFFSKKVIS